MIKRSRWLALTALSGGAYLLWLREQERIASVPPLSPEEAEALVSRALPLLRLPTSPEDQPELAFNTEGDGKFIGLRCPRTHRIYPMRGRVLDLLDREGPLTHTQQLLNTPLRAWAYDRLRDGVMAVSLPPFQDEVADISARLGLSPGDTVLDLCCGPGNFSLALAQQVGPQGLVLALDLSPAMLARAAYHAYRHGATQVLLIRGDAQRLPLAGASVPRINCSGGFHQLPDLPAALREIARVGQPGCLLTASTFATAAADPLIAPKRWLERAIDMHFVDMQALIQQLGALGFVDGEARMAGPLFAYASARKPSPTA